MRASGGILRMQWNWGNETAGDNLRSSIYNMRSMFSLCMVYTTHSIYVFMCVRVLNSFAYIIEIFNLNVQVWVSLKVQARRKTQYSISCMFKMGIKTKT